MCERGSSVFGRVGQRLGDDVVRGDLDRLGQAPLHVNIELDGTAERRVSALMAGLRPPSERIAG